MEFAGGPDGGRRREVADSLWAAWIELQKGGLILTGMSGMGKTEHVVRPFMTAAGRLGRPAVKVEVPLVSLDLAGAVQAALVEELELGGHGELVPYALVSLKAGVSALVRRGFLVVIDEFQRALDPTGRPLEDLGAEIRKIAQRTPDHGCLFLVSNRTVDALWSEPFHVCELSAPDSQEDLDGIVLVGMGNRVDAEARFPQDRRLEVVRRLGCVPRALRLLGGLLRHYDLEELLGPPLATSEPIRDERLLQQIELGLLNKSKEGLSGEAVKFLRRLSILREPAGRDLIDAMLGGEGNLEVFVSELTDRYLLTFSGRRFQVHPLVREVDGARLRADPAAWIAANRRAGDWYAQPLLASAGNPADDASLTRSLSGAHFHLTEAGALDQLRAAVKALSQYLGRQYGWTARRPIDAAERDARIELLSMYLDDPGLPGVEYQLAKLLKDRGGPIDLATAARHAGRATVNQDFSDPWVLWIQILREAEGPHAAVEAAVTAIGQVSPAKSLFTIYQLYGGCLNQQGKTGEAVEALLDGALACVEFNAVRLIEEAIHFAAAESSPMLLRRIAGWIVSRPFSSMTRVVKVALLEHAGDWQGAAEMARAGRTDLPTYIYFAFHEALGWLGCGAWQAAQDALDRFPLPLRIEERLATVWLESLVALKLGDVERASALLAVYLGGGAPTTEAGILAVILREWDYRTLTPGEVNPAFSFANLPASITGSSHARRTQYGEPVLERHRQPDPHHPPTAIQAVLAVATEWNSAHGGLSTFNRNLCIAFAKAGSRVVCLVPRASLDEVDAAYAQGVELAIATPIPGGDNSLLLAARSSLPLDFSPTVIVGHGRKTGPAAVAQAAHFPESRRLHFIHVSADELEWLKPHKKVDPIDEAGDRTQEEFDLGRTAAFAVAVGPRLYERFRTEFYPDRKARVLRFDPGFDQFGDEEWGPPPGRPLRILVQGRLDDQEIKGLDLAAQAVGRVAQRRPVGSSAIALVARGAAAGDTGLREKIVGWSGKPDLDVTVRRFTVDTERLEADLRRASLVLMPSRSEGFGLVGLEAIVAGVPVLISEASGLGEMLHETLGRERAQRFVVPVTRDGEADVDAWARAIEMILYEIDAAFRRAALLREQLARIKTWQTAVDQLLAELKGSPRPL
ncbi:MAG: glycosyltransferase [Caulobacter sp.]|nr:glycosyltransferase [Caulobacter sp.]